MAKKWNNIASGAIHGCADFIDCGEADGGAVGTGPADDAEMKELQRFLIRNNYPHRIVEVPTEQVALLDDGSSNSEPSLLTVTLSDGRV